MEPVSRRPARLLAVVSVDGRASAVRCMNPGCFMSVYAAIHVVEDEGQLLVMGRDCFANRYGGGSALGEPRFGAGGRLLTPEERELLIANTARLLALFEEGQQRAHEPAPSPVQAPAPLVPLVLRRRAYSVAPRSTGSPWPWQKPITSVALLDAGNGRRFVRVQHADGSQKLVPYPVFRGWDSVLPAELARPNHTLQVLDVPSIALALQRLQEMGFRMWPPGRWQEVRQAAGLP